MPGGQHTEVAQAYVTIIPSMKGAQKAISDGLMASATGEKSGKELGEGLSKGLSTMKVAIGTALGSIMRSGLDTIMSGLSSGIERYDTLRNYPKVMQNLGYSADSADRSVSNIKEHLLGLPTGTDEIVRLTQSIADSTDDLDLATGAALGFNDMLLAAGASTAEAASAQGVFNRILGKGSATAAQWSSLTSVMPAQLGMVAKGMLGAEATTEDLHSALEDGTVSWQDFLAEISRLDTEGLDGIAGFEEQARSMTGGIGTAIANIGYRVSQGWEKIIAALNDDNLAVFNTIESFSNGILDFMKGIAEGITYLRDTISETNIGENLGKIFEGIGSWLDRFKGDAIEGLKGFTDTMVGFIDGALQWLVDNGDLVAAVLSGIVGAIEGFMALKLVGTLTELPALLSGIWAVLMANPIVLVVTGVSALVAGLRYFFTETETGKAIWEGFCQGLSDLWEGLKRDFGNMVATIKQNLADNAVQWEQFKTNVGNVIKGVVGFFANLKRDFDNMVAQIKQNLEDNALVWEQFKTKVGKTIEGIKTAAAEKFEAIRKTIEEKVQAAKDKASEIVEGIKSLFKFEWRLPDLKLPHISVGAYIEVPVLGTIPDPSTISVDWYKHGGIFDEPTVAGLGEAGKEAALPLNRRSYQEIADGIANEMDTQGITEDQVTEAVMRAITRLGGLRIILNGRTMATALDSELGMLAFRGTA